MDNMTPVIKLSDLIAVLHKLGITYELESEESLVLWNSDFDYTDGSNPTKTKLEISKNTVD